MICLFTSHHLPNFHCRFQLLGFKYMNWYKTSAIDKERVTFVPVTWEWESWLYVERMLCFCLCFVCPNRNYMNDSLRTNVFVRFQAETIACACIYLAARALQVSENQIQATLWMCFIFGFNNLFGFAQIPLPSRPNWYLLFGASEEEIKDICITTLRLYTRKKVLCLNIYIYCALV